MLYDLHMHSCLSPCAEDDMTPANIAGAAKLAGAELIAVTDHNRRGQSAGGTVLLQRIRLQPAAGASR